MNNEKDSDQCSKELIKQVKALFIDIQLQNNLKERLQKDSYRYIDIYGQLAEYHETISSVIHRVSHHLMKVNNTEQVQNEINEGWMYTDLEKVRYDAFTLNNFIKQAKDEQQQDVKRESNFMDYYSYKSSNISSGNISSLTISVKELIKLEKERFELENQLYRKTKCQTEIYACDVIASIDKVIDK